MSEKANASKFVDDEELIGKTIAKIVKSDFEPMSIVFHFTDGTWTRITYGGGWYAGEGCIEFDDSPLQQDEL